MQEDIIIQISKRLKDIRKEKDITLQQLVDVAGVSKGMLSQVENSRTIASLTVLPNPNLFTITLHFVNISTIIS